MKTNYKKILKLSMLLVSSLLIATASASVYTQMFLKAKVGVAGASLQWSPGTNPNATVNIVGSLCTIDGLDGIAGQTVIFDDVVRIKNAGSKAVTFNITVTKCSGSTSNLTSIFVEMYEDGTLKNTLIVWNGSKGDPLTNLSIGTGGEWTLTWKITWSNNAVTSDYVDVELRLDVKS
ncbi:MAG: hypothetical protein QW660_07100 [Candidatus Bathyarchaeia archaeon]